MHGRFFLHWRRSLEQMGQSTSVRRKIERSKGLTILEREFVTHLSLKIPPFRRRQPQAERKRSLLRLSFVTLLVDTLIPSAPCRGAPQAIRNSRSPGREGNCATDASYGTLLMLRDLLHQTRIPRAHGKDP